ALLGSVVEGCGARSAVLTRSRRMRSTKCGPDPFAKDAVDEVRLRPVREGCGRRSAASREIEPTAPVDGAHIVDGRASDACVAKDYFATLMTSGSIYPLSPTIEYCRPSPDSFAPPNGTNALVARCWLTHAVPTSRRSAIALPRSRLFVQTEPESP